MPAICCRFVACMFFLTVGLGACVAQTANKEFVLTTDNDVYLLTTQDRYYTNGIELSYQQGFKAKNAAKVASILSIQAGQKMYTGIRIEDSDYLGKQFDLPFNAYLYINAEWRQVFTADRDLWALKIEAAQIGPKAKGEQAQRFIHQLFDMYPADGWEGQIENAFGVDIEARYQRKIALSSNKKWELSTSATGRLGMHHTFVEWSLPVRFGKFVNFNHSTWTKGHLTTDRSALKECYVFYMPSIKRNFYDATIQGGLWKDDPIGDFYDLNEWVVSHHIGLTWARTHWSGGISYFFLSREEPHSIYRHQYGRLFLGYRF